MTVCLGVGGLFLLLLAFGSFTIRGILSQPKGVQAKCDFKSMQAALDVYNLEGGSYPTTAQGLKALIEKPSSDPAPAKWQQIMKVEPLDPWNNPYVYKFPGSKDPTKPELISKGPDGIEGTADDLSSQDP